MWPFSKRNKRHTLPTSKRLASEISPELDRHFSAIASSDFSELWDLEINLLDRAQSQKWTNSLAPHPIVYSFDGIVLDDPNTSNHHIYLNHPALKGCVFYLSHDGESRVVFSSLEEFMTVVEAAKRDRLSLPELHSSSPIAADQTALSQLISGLLQDTCADNEVAVLSIIPSMDLRDEILLRQLVADPNFFYGEAVAQEVEKRPDFQLLELAELCFQHPHSQVRKAGQRALTAIQRLR